MFWLFMYSFDASWYSRVNRLGRRSGCDPSALALRQIKKEQDYPCFGKGEDTEGSDTRGNNHRQGSLPCWPGTVTVPEGHGGRKQRVGC